MKKKTVLFVAFIGIVIMSVFFQNCARMNFEVLEPVASASSTSEEDIFASEEGVNIPSENDFAYDSDNDVFVAVEVEDPIVEDPVTEEPSVVQDPGTTESLAVDCAVTFQKEGTSKTKVYNREECEDYYLQLRNNNPTLTIVKVLFGDQVLLQKTVTTYSCQVTLQGAGIVASQMGTESACLDYYAELKKNNPTKTITLVTFNGKTLYKK